MSSAPALRRLRQSAAADDGFTLIEAIVSFIVFAIVAAGATSAIYRAINASHETQQRVGAAAVAQQVIANAIAEANQNTATPEAGKTFVSALGNSQSSQEEFTVVRTITFDGGGNTCSPGKTFTVNVVVKQRQTGKFLARCDSEVACPPV